MPVISHTHAEPDFGPIIQMSPTRLNTARLPTIPSEASYLTRRPPGGGETAKGVTPGS